MDPNNYFNIIEFAIEILAMSLEIPGTPSQPKNKFPFQNLWDSLGIVKKASWNGSHYLEDHPMTCKWLITLVKKSPK